jgi:hypothetical protein
MQATSAQPQPPTTPCEVIPNWRLTAELVIHEHDSGKLAELVARLCRELDDQRRGRP